MESWALGRKISKNKDQGLVFQQYMNLFCTVDNAQK
jgi:hypothetical protein